MEAVGTALIVIASGVREDGCGTCGFRLSWPGIASGTGKANKTMIILLIIRLFNLFSFVFWILSSELNCPARPKTHLVSLHLHHPVSEIVDDLAVVPLDFSPFGFAFWPVLARREFAIGSFRQKRPVLDSIAS